MTVPRALVLLTARADFKLAAKATPAQSGVAPAPRLRLMDGEAATEPPIVTHKRSSNGGPVPPFFFAQPELESSFLIEDGWPHAPNQKVLPKTGIFAPKSNGYAVRSAPAAVTAKQRAAHPILHDP